MSNDEIRLLLKEIGIMRFTKQYVFMVSEREMLAKAGWRMNEGYVVRESSIKYLLELKLRLLSAKDKVL